MKNRISEYSASDWLALLVQQRLIEYGEPVVAAHQAMLQHPEICKFEEKNFEEEYD